MFYFLKHFIFVLIISFSYSKNNILSSNFKNVNITLEKNKNFTLFIKELSSEENIFHYFSVTGHFLVLKDAVNFFIKNGKLVLHLHSDKKNTFQVIGDNVQVSYQEASIFSNKIDAYIDLEHHKNIDLIFESNYKITYKNFQFGSYNRLYYRNFILIGNNLLGKNFNLGLSISIEKLEANVQKQNALFCNVCIKNPTLNLFLRIDKVSLENKDLLCHDSNLSIQNKKFFIKNMKILNDSILINEISLLNENLSFFSPNASISFDQKQLILENTVVKKKNFLLKIKKVSISLYNMNKADLFEIQLFSNNKLVSTNTSGYFDFKSNSLVLINGNIHLQFS